MMVESVNTAVSPQVKTEQPFQQIEQKRQQVEDQVQADESESQIQPEELLSQIKSLTEDGVYSVRFEKDDEAGELVVKVVDSESDEVIRQIPPEELLNLSKNLKELSGNIVNSEI
ncbi:flagellar protein FlaG [Desulfobulbus rhabdoformis]|uniref:flagellar protein FlaG n=1 Tax=Desulfobulbus rhabdoformis TaxID=34032 RepID=UPI00196299C0|nr:flagellar protein FlaG [Desulfobulbus rhabdoformis]MBM9614484.1 flagellar protein FlaG [Desulfobulbus rhabdoformis]